jgi:rhamnogalacturonyl hydrolase YesR
MLRLRQLIPVQNQERQIVVKRRQFIQALACTGFFANSSWLRVMAAQQLTANESLPAVGDSPDDPGPLATGLASRLVSTDIRKAMQKVGSWELRRTESAFNTDWTFAALYAGLLAAGETLRDAKYETAMMQMGSELRWQLGPDEIHADHQAVGQTYLELYLRHHQAEMLAPTKVRFDRMILRKDDPAKPLWWWCDALFMAPPVLARLYAATGNKAYLDYMDRQWWITSNTLYDPSEHLYYRDTRYFDKTEANGQKLFWSRGNGWVMGGLARVLQYMRRDYPSRERYIIQFTQMAQRLRDLQGEDGLWRSGLLDQGSYKLPEVSGSALIAYGIAWGINAGVLDRRTFYPTLEKAWAGMVANIYQDGRLGCIQPVSAAPGQFKRSSSYVYGVGGFLLLGSEIDKLVRGPSRETSTSH